MRETVRRVRFAPYRPGMGPRFALTLWDTGRTTPTGKARLAYRLRMLPPKLRDVANLAVSTDCDFSRPNGHVPGCYCQALVDAYGAKPVTLFEGDDFGASPLHAVDSDETVAALMGLLTLRPGDTDPDYFADYTPEQLRFCTEHAETLACEVEARFGEGGH